jgi:two-component system, response regulator, stage 0 sporulation protein F
MRQNLKILYVDDEPINLILFRSVFKAHFLIHTAESGKSGMKILDENENIDVVISDMRMPGMDGLAFISKARELYPSVIFFILTGYEVTPEIQSSIDSGLVCKCFQKPLNIKEITDSISERLT